MARVERDVASPARDLHGARLSTPAGCPGRKPSAEAHLPRRSRRGAPSAPAPSVSVASPGPAGPSGRRRPLITSSEALAALLAGSPAAAASSASTPALQQVGNREHLIGLGLSVGAGQRPLPALAHRYLGAPVQLPLAELGPQLAAALASGRIALGAYDVKQRQRGAGGELRAGGVRRRRASPLTRSSPATCSIAELEHGLHELAQRELALHIDATETLTRPQARNADAARRGERGGAGRARGAPGAGGAALWPLLEARLVENELSELFTQLELPLQPCSWPSSSCAACWSTLEPARRARRADRARLARARKRGADGRGQRRSTCNSPRQLETLLFDELGLKPLKRTKTSRSTDAATLEALADEHQLPRQSCSRSAKLAKLKGTYIDALPALVDPTPAASTRAGSRPSPPPAASRRPIPNLQNIPIRTELGRKIRARVRARRPATSSSAPTTRRSSSACSRTCPQDPVLLDAFRTARTCTRARRWRSSACAPDGVTREHRTPRQGRQLRRHLRAGRAAASPRASASRERSRPVHRRLFPALPGRAALHGRDAGAARQTGEAVRSAARPAAAAAGHPQRQPRRRAGSRAHRHEHADPGHAPPTCSSSRCWRCERRSRPARA